MSLLALQQQILKIQVYDLVIFPHIWADSRMKIGCPIKQDMDSIKFNFPFFKYGEKDQKITVLTTIEEAHQQLDQ